MQKNVGWVDVGNPTPRLMLGFADAQPNLRLMHNFSLDSPVGCVNEM
ncbi:hypothetical protein LC593_14740 [Nostoc sp. CHAB 5844]|nr:hypothetical protein [Nostoc sp. CHAB 5844]